MIFRFSAVAIVSQPPTKVYSDNLAALRTFYNVLDFATLNLGPFNHHTTNKCILSDIDEEIPRIYHH